MNFQTSSLKKTSSAILIFLFNLKMAQWICRLRRILRCSWRLQGFVSCICGSWQTGTAYGNRVVKKVADVSCNLWIQTQPICSGCKNRLTVNGMFLAPIFCLHVVFFSGVVMKQPQFGVVVALSDPDSFLQTRSCIPSMNVSFISDGLWCQKLPPCLPYQPTTCEYDNIVLVETDSPHYPS